MQMFSMENSWRNITNSHHCNSHEGLIQVKISSFLCSKIMGNFSFFSLESCYVRLITPHLPKKPRNHLHNCGIAPICMWDGDSVSFLELRLPSPAGWGELKQQKSTVSQSWRLTAQDQGVGRAVSSEASLLLGFTGGSLLPVTSSSFHRRLCPWKTPVRLD